MGRPRKTIKRQKETRAVVLDLDDLDLLIRGCRRLASEFPLADANDMAVEVVESAYGAPVREQVVRDRRQVETERRIGIRKGDLQSPMEPLAVGQRETVREYLVDVEIKVAGRVVYSTPDI